MDSLDSDTAIDAEIEELLRKEAAATPFDRQQELQVLARWKQAPTKEDFDYLYNKHKPLIYRASERSQRSTTLPKSAVESNVLRNYIVSLKAYDPNKDTQLSTIIYNNMNHTGRYLARYQNIGTIPGDRSSLIGLFQNRMRTLTDQLGREPTNTELVDDMNSSMKDVAELQQKARKPVTVKQVALLRREIRDDKVSELPGGEARQETSPLLEHMMFTYPSLNPDQKLVFEHTYDGFGKPVIENPMELGPKLNMSPQKVRSLRKQIADRAYRSYY